MLKKANFSIQTLDLTLGKMSDFSSEAPGLFLKHPLLASQKAAKGLRQRLIASLQRPTVILALTPLVIRVYPTNYFEHHSKDR